MSFFRKNHPIWMQYSILMLLLLITSCGETDLQDVETGQNFDFVERSQNKKSSALEITNTSESNFYALISRAEDEKAVVEKPLVSFRVDFSEAIKKSTFVKSDITLFGSSAAEVDEIREVSDSDATSFIVDVKDIGVDESVGMIIAANQIDNADSSKKNFKALTTGDVGSHVQAGYRHSCILKEDHTVWCWGT